MQSYGRRGTPADRAGGADRPRLPAARQVRSIPLPTVSRGAGRTAVYPDDPVARVLFESVGDVVVPRDEPALATFSTATATFAALGRTLLQHSGTLEDLARKHTTPGGINERFLADLRGDGLRDSVLARVSGQ